MHVYLYHHNQLSTFIRRRECRVNANATKGRMKKSTPDVIQCPRTLTPAKGMHPERPHKKKRFFFPRTKTFQTQWNVAKMHLQNSQPYLP